MVVARPKHFHLFTGIYIISCFNVYYYYFIYLIHSCPVMIYIYLSKHFPNSSKIIIKQLILVKKVKIIYKT